MLELVPRMVLEERSFESGTTWSQREVLGLGMAVQVLVADLGLGFSPNSTRQNVFKFGGGLEERAVQETLGYRIFLVASL